MGRRGRVPKKFGEKFTMLPQTKRSLPAEYGKPGGYGISDVIYVTDVGDSTGSPFSLNPFSP